MNMEHAIYLLVFFIPTYLVRFQLFGIPTNLWEATMGLVFLIWFFSYWRGHGVLSQEYWRKWKRSFVRGFLFFLGLFLLFVGLLVGTVMSPEPLVSLGALKGWLILPLLFAAMARAVLVHPHQKENALLSFAFSGVGVSLLAIVYWWFGDFTFDGRVRAFYESPNMLAMYIAPAILILQGLGMKSKIHSASKDNALKPWYAMLRFRVEKFFYSPQLRIVATLLLAVCLLLTRSLGAIAILAVIFIFLWGRIPPLLTIVSKGGIPSRRGYAVFFMGMLVASGVALPFVSLLINPWTLTASSFASRLMIWKSALSMARDYGMVGRGLGTFQYDYLLYQTEYPPYLEWAVPHPHNIFLGTLVAGGVLGFAGLLCVIVGMLFLLHRAFLFSSRPSTAIFLVFLYLLLHGAIDNTLWRGDMAIIFWLMFALK